MDVSQFDTGLQLDRSLVLPTIGAAFIVPIIEHTIKKTLEAIYQEKATYGCCYLMRQDYSLKTEKI